MSRIALLLAVAACTMLAVPAAGLAATGHGHGHKKKAKPVPQQLYVSLGDSYASGYQPTGVGVGSNTTNGFAYQVPAAAKTRGYRLKLVNFGCGGATTTSILQQIGCAPAALGPNGTAYPTTTQVAAATAYIKAHRKQVGLITVSIGGNDVTKCAKADDAIACVGDAVNGIKTNVTALVTQLRAAAGPKVRIVGITYPDVILGGWVQGTESAQNLAKLSIVAFQALINPALKAAYASGQGGFVDVTAATGAYGPFDATTTLDPYGVLPVPVATVCELTYYCQFGDIHAKTPGYKLIADLVAGTLPKRKR
jgi:lysophospholipase L1-like esterase